MNERRNEQDIKIVKALQKEENLYVILSDSTRLPFVECNSDTYDDEILIFTDREAAEREVWMLSEAGYPVRAGTIPKNQRLPFFSGLFSMGINALLLDKRTKQAHLQELREVIIRPEVPRFTEEIGEKLRKGEQQKFVIENPEFHLTAIYFTQKVRSKKAYEYVDEIKQLQEEMMAHYQEGYYISARTEEGHVPILQGKDGTNLQPIFTDMQEFVKFQQTYPGKKLKTSVVSEKDFVRLLAKEASAVVVNPFGISLVLQIKRKSPEQM